MSLLTLLRRRGGIYLRDLFAGVDGTALSSHAPDVGAGVWTQNIGTWHIQSNHLEPNSHADGSLATFPLGLSDFILTCDVTPWDNGTAASIPGLVFRYTSDSAYWLVQLDSRLNLIYLYEKTGASTYVERARVTLVMDSLTAYPVIIKCIGPDITITVGAATPWTYVSTANQTATSIGVRVGTTGSPGTNRSRWDNLLVVPFSGTDYNWPIFTKYVSNPVVTKGAAASWEDVDIANPDVFYDTPNSRWVMNYSGFDGAQWHTGLAYSTDLLTWTKEAANPVLSPVSEGYIAGNGTIAYKAGTYYLYYQVASPNTRIMLATSSDLLTWTRIGVAVDKGSTGQFDATAVADPMVRLLANGSFEMYYCGVGALPGLEARGIGRATSSDGVTWTKQGRVFPVPSLADATAVHGEPFVLGEGASHMITFDGATGSEARRIFQAYTLDGGATWVYRKNALVAGSGWESAQVFDSCLVLDNGTLYLFYAGATLPGAAENLNAQIGVATAPWIGVV
jgi:predicted GH43/DUF377 family glycosyl hydrolase